MKVDGKRILVTGGSSGIGLAIAQVLILRGARVAINGRDRAKLDEAAAGLGCTAIPGDVGVQDDAARIVSTFVEEEGGIDVLINNAGFGRFAPLVETDPAAFESIWRTNVLGAFLMAKEVAQHLVAQESGAIVNVASTAALKGFAGGTAYAASKFALRGMNECWREELRRSNVRVILINPSEVQTEFAASAGYEQVTSTKKLVPEDIAHAALAALEMDDRGFIPELAVFATNPF